jgi:hypothetical protein
MECNKCKYFNRHNDSVVFGVCSITSRCNTKSCTLSSDEDVKHMHICYNCQHWHGMGDWGLSCAKNYYDCSSDGFRQACEQFERKSMISTEVALNV